MKDNQSKDRGPKVGIIMGSDSDLKVMKNAALILEELSIPYEIKVVSAHRTPERMFEYGKTAHGKGIEVIIAGAGGAAHLPGMIASLTQLPVIGVPVKLQALEGIDSLLSIVQMPGGVPVATVGINNAKNAGLLAVRILAIKDQALYQKLNDRCEAIKETLVYDLSEQLKEHTQKDD
jgi:5-(carboxyamino)imidazole ribonucleotide mutase